MTSLAPSAVPSLGTAAPDFTLDSTAGAPVTLSALRGKTVLLAFFPLAFTSTCTAELCDMRDDYDQFAAQGVTVLPISVDSVPTLKEYKARYRLRAELLSDFKRTASQAYGVLLPERFYSNRAYFLIDPEGILRWSHVEANPSMKRTNAELFEAIAQLR
ncbi:MAG: redoxin domain-containing protein [Gemmatimonadaceae bacterium]